MLVNSWNKIPKDYCNYLDYAQGQYQLDFRIIKDYKKMMDDLRIQGKYPLLISAYRDEDFQRELFENELDNFYSLGYDLDLGRKLSLLSTAYPKTSEHHLGLAIDIIDEGYPTLDKNQERADVQRWLMTNSYKYGFILRYPNEKNNITGIMYEPWHYRYVGKPIAKYIKDNNITLEEYVSSMDKFINYDLYGNR